ncbi:hypothetical protein ABEX25_05670 [Paenibacillus thiaminolyticus]|uniref:hypothetical protein n=1 Tax=Paenibacillus thiaminolyticus TaxID=49283 RepID=UPI003D2A4060
MQLLNEVKQRRMALSPGTASFVRKQSRFFGNGFVCPEAVPLLRERIPPRAADRMMIM